MPDWSQLAVGVAACAALVYVTRTMKSLMSDVLKFMYNHHSDITRALTAVATRLEALDDSVDRHTDKHDQASV